MIEHVADARSVTTAGFDRIIDVRSPSEFRVDHVPGAVNLPVLDDDERTLVGTMYVQDDPFRARRLGAALVSRNIAKHLEGPLAGLGGGWRPLVYCWRGGQRSNAFATVLSQVGWRTAVLTGGYRTYRRAVVTALYEPGPSPPFVVLDGAAGVGKTELLAQLAVGGMQVIDLEALASHRGSLFGAVIGAPQPSQKLFESRLHAALAALHPTRPVVIEGESSKLGEIVLPPRLWRAMTDAPSITLTAPIPARVRRLVMAYGGDARRQASFETALNRLPRHIGRKERDAWRALLHAGALETLACELLETHYDPAYRRSALKTPRPVLGVVETKLGSLREMTLAANRILELVTDRVGGS